jgi:hypothetical protein
MEFLGQISFDEVVGAFVACMLIREIMVFALPDRVAGPGGWLIDTETDEA